MSCDLERLVKINQEGIYYSATYTNMTTRIVGETLWIKMHLM